MEDPIFVLAVLMTLVLVSDYLSKKGIGKHLGTALMVILFTAVVANIGIIPTASNSIPLYTGIFEYLAPLSIFYLLLGVKLSEIRRAGGKLIFVFVLGSLATVCGILISAVFWNIEDALGPESDVLAGMFTGTYTGGSINFNAIAINYKVHENGLLYAGAVAIDNVITTFWMLMTLIIPLFLFKAKKAGNVAKNAGDSKLQTKSLNLKSLIVLLVSGFVTLWASIQLSMLSKNLGFEIPSILILTTIALVFAQLPIVKRLKGSEILGLYSVYLFLAVIGAYCEIDAMLELASVGASLALFTFSAVIIHGLIIFGLGGLFLKDAHLLSVASQANIGGGTTALALAESFGRSDLLLPAILMGALGNALGTYLGFLVIAVL